MKNFTKFSSQNNQGGSTSISEVKNIDSQKSKNLTSSDKESESQDIKNFVAINNTNINNTKYNNINQSIYQSTVKYINETERMMEGYERLIKNNIDYDSWMLSRDLRNREIVEELYNLILDVVCVKQDKIRINGEEYPYELVKARFLKIRRRHIEYTLERLKCVTSKINNVREYNLTVLYNSLSSMNCYYQQEVQFDMYGGGDYGYN